MDIDEKELSEKRKKNMKLFSIHRMLTADLLFYYAIKFIFLSQIKGLSASNIVLATAFFGIFRALFQIPTIILIDKLGHKKSLVLSDLISAISVIFVMLSTNLSSLIFANLLSGCAFAIKDVSENGLLNDSIPETEDKSKIFSKIDAKGLGKYYIISAISAMFSGFLFEVNGYIPMCICTIILVIASIVASNFNELNPIKNTEKISKTIFKESKEYFKNLRYGFSFIFHSRRLKALMLFTGIMFGMISVMNIYEMGLLNEINVSSSAVGIIYASMQIVAAISSKMHVLLHNKFKNKALTVIGMSYVISCLIAGIVCISGINYIILLLMVIITYIIRYIDTGAYQVLMKKYITNFTNVEVQNKVYSAYGIVTGLGSTTIGVIGTIIAARNDLKMSLVIFGAIFFVIMVMVLNYMKTRVGLKPEEYRKKDIDYREYISLK